MKKDVRVYLRDIIERAGRIETYTVNGRDAFDRSTLIQDAVLRNFEVIGEAAKRIPADFRLRYPDVQWQRMTGFRDVLIHDYDGINLDRVWETIHFDLPPLLPRLREILQELEDASSK